MAGAPYSDVFGVGPVGPILSEHWVVEGIPTEIRSDSDDALYIKPLLQSNGLVAKTTKVLHSLILDNNVLTDLLEERRPANNRYLENLLRTVPVELNPTLALIEQRQKYAKASEALVAYADYLERTFGHRIAKTNIAEFDAVLELHRPAVVENVELLAGYLSAIVFIYNQTTALAPKLELLSGLITHNDLPFFQLHYYFAALVFLAKDSPSLFSKSELEKIEKDMKLEATFDKQKKKILNLSNDLILPAIAIFRDQNLTDTLIFPYIATRDRLVQLFLRQVTCQAIIKLDDSRSAGAWALKEGEVLATHAGTAVEAHMPRRIDRPKQNDRAVRKSRLLHFTDAYILKGVALRNGLL